MKQYKVTYVEGNFGIFLDDIVVAEDTLDAKEQVLEEIIDNIGNYIDIEVEEVEEDDEDCI